MTLVRLAKEEEGVGISAGAHLAGVKSAMLMQNHGFLASINGIVSCAQLYRIPLLMLVSYRGEFGERDPWQTEGGGVTEDLLRALQNPVRVSRSAGSRGAPHPQGADARVLRQQAGRAAAVPRSDVGRSVVTDGRRRCAASTRCAPSTIGSKDKVVVTIMGAVAAELQSIGHRPNFFYLQHAMGLASSMGLGIALTRPELPGRRVRRRRLGAHEPRRPDHAGAVPAAQPGARRVRQREPAVGRRLPDRDVDRQRSRRRSPRPPACRAPARCATLDDFTRAFDEALACAGADDARRQGGGDRARPATSPTWHCSRTDSSFRRWLRQSLDRSSSTISTPAA